MWIRYEIPGTVRIERISINTAIQELVDKYEKEGIEVEIVSVSR